MHHESSLRSRKSLPDGHALLSYKIESILGAGGFGITYLATDTNLNRAVAIKEYFPEQFASRDDDGNVHAISETESKAFVWGRERFLKEGQILARFSANPRKSGSETVLIAHRTKTVSDPVFLGFNVVNFRI